MLLKAMATHPEPELIRELQWVTARSRSALTRRRHAPLALTRVADDALGGYPESGFDQADLRRRIVLPAPEQPRACGYR